MENLNNFYALNVLQNNVWTVQLKPPLSLDIELIN